MSLVGKLLNGVSLVATCAGGVAVAAAGEIIGAVGDVVAPDNAITDGIRNTANHAGNVMWKNGRKVGATIEKGVDQVFETSGNVGGAIASCIADAAGATEEGRAKAEKVGRIVGGATVGFVVGDAISGAMLGAAAGGAASTGTAISSLHGIAATNATYAALGGGSLAAGGMGVAGGQAIVAATTAASTVAGGAASASKNNE